MFPLPMMLLHPKRYLLHSHKVDSKLCVLFNCIGGGGGVGGECIINFRQLSLSNILETGKAIPHISFLPIRTMSNYFSTPT